MKNMIEAEPPFGYRTVAALLGMNENTVQRIFQLKGWQVRKRPLDQRPRIDPNVSRAEGRINVGLRICAKSGAARMVG